MLFHSCLDMSLTGCMNSTQAVQPILSRRFYTLDTSNESYSMQSGQTFTGDFSISLNFSIEETGSTFFGAADGGFFGPVWQVGYVPPAGDQSSTITFIVPGSLTSFDVDLTTSDFNRLEVSRSGDTVSLIVNGNVIGTVVFTGEYKLQYFGRDSTGSNFAHGVLANIQVVDDGELLYDVAIDEELLINGQILTNRGSASDSISVQAFAIGNEIGDVALDGNGIYSQVSDGWEGEEILQNGDFSDTSAWNLPTGVSISGGACRFQNANDVFVTQSYSQRFERGLRYRTRLDVNPANENFYLPYDDGNTEGRVVAETGSNVGSFIAEAQPQTITFGGGGTNYTGVVDNASLKRYLRNPTANEARGSFGPGFD